MPKVSLTARYATWTAETQPTKSYFGQTSYVAVSGATGGRMQSILWFSSPFDPDGGNVVKATLTIKTRKITGAGTHSITAGLASKWSLRFGWVNFSNRPGYAGTTVTTTKAGVQADGVAWTFDMTKQMQAVADGQGMYGIVLSSTAAEILLVDGASSGVRAATLDVEWTMAPKPPTSLAPSSGRAVSVSRPVLRWDFFDHSGEKLLKAIQMQTSTAASFASVEWDSGAISTHWCTLDLASTTFPAMTSGQVVWWRVRNQDTAGLWSGWSAPQSFTYRPLPTVTLQNPSPATPYIVDPTPPIGWTVAGGTQASWRVGIYVWNATRGWILVDQSGLQTGTATSWTPAKPLQWTDATYRIAVDVFDGVQREVTPGALDYASDSEDVQWKPTSPVTSATNPKATILNSAGWMDLTWTNAQQPDVWLVYRDGKMIYRGVGASLLRGSAPSYGFTDRWVPSGEHRWWIVGIGGDKRWEAAGITATVDMVGTWLVNEETGAAVCFVGDTEHDMVMPEDVAVHTPLGGRYSVAVTSGQRGYEGTIAGVIIDTPRMPDGHSATYWHDTLMAFKADVGQTYRLVVEGISFPVKVTNITAASIPGYARQAWRASFAFRQIDEFLF